METITEKRTDFLFPKRNFFTGFASIFSIAGDVRINTSNSGEEADCKAISNDWDMIGQDFRTALNKLNKDVSFK